MNVPASRRGRGRSAVAHARRARRPVRAAAAGADAADRAGRGRRPDAVERRARVPAPAADRCGTPGSSAPSRSPTSPRCSPRRFWSSLRTTIIYTVGGTLGSIAVGLVAALALRGTFRGRGVVRAAMLLPYVAPVVAVTFVWQLDAEPAVRHRQPVGAEVPRAGTSRSTSCPALGEAPCSGRVGAGRPADRDRVRDLAVLPVRLPLPHRPAPGDPERPRGGGHHRRRDAAPAVPVHRAPAAVPT